MFAHLHLAHHLSCFVKGKNITSQCKIILFDSKQKLFSNVIKFSIPLIGIFLPQLRRVYLMSQINDKKNSNFFLMRQNHS